MTDMSWSADAKCIGKTELFFPPVDNPEDSKTKRKRERDALELCKVCPVMLQCRSYARSAGELGIWGGEKEKERWLGGYLSGASSGFRRRPENYFQEKYKRKKEKELLATVDSEAQARDHIEQAQSTQDLAVPQA